MRQFGKADIPQEAFIATRLIFQLRLYKLVRLDRILIRKPNQMPHFLNVAPGRIRSCA
jgi:hypothetical protein